MERGWLPLLANVANAFDFSPLLYRRSIFGDAKTCTGQPCKYSELRQVGAANFPRNIRTLGRILLPGWPGTPSWWPDQLEPLGIIRNSRALPFPVTAEQVTDFADESWLFINGICTDEAILYLNAQYLFELFGRPLTLLHNQTHSWWVDLLECGVGKGWGVITEAVRALFPAFYSELKRPDIRRVVLIAHSQGTILSALFLGLLRKLMGKLCADPQSYEQQCADRLLSHNPEQWGAANARYMNPEAGIAGSSLVSCSTTAWPNASVAGWLNWGKDEILGLPPLTRDELRKLEIYSFAPCATDFTYIEHDEDGTGYPYIEHFGNEMDPIARMGLYSPASGLGAVRTDGQRFIAEQAWGHLLNAHYLSSLELQWRQQKTVFLPRIEYLAQNSRLQSDFYSTNTTKAVSLPCSLSGK